MRAFTAATDQTLTKTPLAFNLAHSVATLHCQGRPVSVAINRLKQLRACDLLAFKLFNASTDRYNIYIYVYIHMCIMYQHETKVFHILELL